MSTIPFGTMIKEYSIKANRDTNYPVCSVTNVNGVQKSSETFSKQVFSNDLSNYKKVYKDSFVYSPPRINVGSIGCQRVADCVLVSPLYVVFDIDKNKTSTEFVSFFLKSNYVRTYIKEHTQGSVRANFKISEMSKLRFPNIPIEEQHEIIKELNLIVKAIDESKKILLLFDELIASRFSEMFDNKQYDVLPWKDVFVTKTGKLDSNAMVEGGKYPFFTCAKEIYAIDEYAFDQEALLLAGNNAAGKYDVKYYKGKFNAYQRTYVLSLKKEWSYLLFKYQLETKLEWLREQSKGSNTRYITLKILEDLTFIVPPKNKQLEFDIFINVVEKNKKTIKTQIEYLYELFEEKMDSYFRD